MRNLITHLLLCLPLAFAGCGKGSEAAPRAAPHPPPQDPSAHGGPPIVESPVQNAASSVPGADLLGKVDVEVLSVEADLLAPPEAVVGLPVSVLIRVTSRQERPRLRVEARRFYIDADKSAKIQARPASDKEPQLPSAYLKAGESVEGWLTFEVPRTAKRLVLKSDLRRPPLEASINIRGGSPGG